MSKKLIVILSTILLSAAVILTGVILYPTVFGPSDVQGGENKKPVQPDEWMLHYFTLLNEGRYEELYPKLSDHSQGMISQEDFVEKHQNIYGGIGAANLSVTIKKVSDYTPKDETTVKTNGKVVEYTLGLDTTAGKITLTNSARLTQDENEQYRLEWSPQSIFPSLTWQDKVRVNTTKAQRGCIYDRNGEILAGPGIASAVGFVPGKMRKAADVQPTEAPDDIPTQTPSKTNDQKAENNKQPKASEKPKEGEKAPVDEKPPVDEQQPAASTTPLEDLPDTPYSLDDIVFIAERLEMTPESIIKKLNASYVKDDTFVLLKTVSKEAYPLKEELLTIPGIKISDTPVRYYPMGEKASHLVGYIQGINAEELEAMKDQGYHMNSLIGKAGLEKIYEEQLRASDGCEIIVVDGTGKTKETLAKREPSDGQDITLTIDAQIQDQLYSLFCEDKGNSVAMNPKTGEVLALVSTPSYDANDFVLGLSSSKWAALNEDENKPMFNRFKAALCPGSTMKAITAAIALNTGVVAPKDDFGASGLKWRKDNTWGGYYITTTKAYEGAANVENALVYSDNIYFAKAAMKIGADRFAQELVNIGFEERIPFEYGLYSSIISSTETFTSEIQLADSGFGQGQILTNPIHLATIYAAFVNEGNIIQPTLRYGSSPTFWKEGAFSPETATTIKNALIQVVERGTGTEAKIAGKKLGGKTGTAEIKQSKEDETGTELGWFVLFTADNSSSPLLVVSMVEDVKGRGGSHYVVPKVKALFE